MSDVEIIEKEKEKEPTSSDAAAKPEKSNAQGGATVKQQQKTKPETASSKPKECDWCGEAWDEAISGQFRPAPDVKSLLQFFHTVEGLAGRGMSMITRAYPEINNPATMKRIQKLKVHFPSPEEIAQQAAAADQQKTNKNMSKPQPQQQQQQQQQHQHHQQQMQSRSIEKPKPKSDWKAAGPSFQDRGRVSRFDSRYNPIRRNNDANLGSMRNNNINNDQPRWRSRESFDASPSERSIWVGHNQSFINDMQQRRRAPSPQTSGLSMGSRMDSVGGRNYGGYPSSSQMDKASYNSPFGGGSSYSMQQQGYGKDNYGGNSDMMEHGGLGQSSMHHQQSSQWSSAPVPLLDSKPLALERSMSNAPYGTSSSSNAGGASDESMQRLLLSVMKGTGGNPQSLHDQEIMQRMLQQLMGGMQGNMSSDGSMLGRQGGMM